MGCDHYCSCETCSPGCYEKNVACVKRGSPVALPDPPDSWMEAALEELRTTLASKNEDYRIDGEFSNFEFASEVAGVPTPEIMLAQIGIKLGRLQGLRAEPNNEKAIDTYKDLAGYAVILYGYMLSTYDAKLTEGYENYGDMDS